MTVAQLMTALEQMPKQAHVLLLGPPTNKISLFDTHEVDRVTHAVWRGDFPTKHTVYLEYHD